MNCYPAKNTLERATIENSVSRNCLQKYMQNSKNNAKLKWVQPKFSFGLGENEGKIIATLNFGNL